MTSDLNTDLLTGPLLRVDCLSAPARRGTRDGSETFETLQMNIANPRLTAGQSSIVRDRTILPRHLRALPSGFDAPIRLALQFAQTK